MSDTDERLARIRDPDLPMEGRLVLAKELLASDPDRSVLVDLGSASEGLVDLRYLNDPSPTDPFFGELCDRLEAALEATSNFEEGWLVAWGLSTVARVCGRSRDAACERAHQVLTLPDPPRWVDVYNHGLFLKIRGRFAESMAANERAMALGGADDDAVVWNLGIAATAIGEGERALGLWREKLGAVLELGADGLPTGTWPACQVRLAEHPLAERSVDQDGPGLEETVWVQRLSPCHGRIRSALFNDLGVDYGDVVLFDGAPVVVRRRGDREVPVYPHLATIRREGWTNLAFSATQQGHHDVDQLGRSLPGDLDLYVHTDRYRVLCRSCWEQAEHAVHGEEEEHRVVTGKLVAPPGMALTAVGEALDAGLKAAGTVRLYVPDLWAAVGDVPRAEVERRRAGMLQSARITG